MRRFLFLVLFLFKAIPSYSSELELIAPLTESAWTVLSYNKIPPNNVTFDKGTLSVRVRSSAGPIVHKLDQPRKISGFGIKAQLSGLKALETGSFDEDSFLRFGLVSVGQKTLKGPQKWFATAWVKKLFSLVPDGTGLDKIYFFNITNRSELIGRSRLHPKSDLMFENVFASHDKQGAFDFTKKLESPIDTAAIWISIDGDDTKSEYETVISEIKLKVIQ